MGVKSRNTGEVAPVMKMVMEFHWRCDKPGCTSSVTTDRKSPPAGWKYHRITGSEYSWWDAIWCKECDESFERSMKKSRSAMRIKDAERKRADAIKNAKWLLEENHYRVIDPGSSGVQIPE